MLSQSLNNILYSNDPDEIPLTDIEAAADLPYDTDIPEDDADIPEDPNEAFKQNAMKITRLEAVKQVKSMVNLVDDIAANALKSMVAGEELDTAAPLGHHHHHLHNHDADDDNFHSCQE